MRSSLRSVDPRVLAGRLLLSLSLVSSIVHAGAPPARDGDTRPPVAQAPESEPDEGPQATDLETIVVSGIQPGPGLWKVRKGEHVMWVLGSQNPLPKRMEWDSANVERRIAQSERVLLLPKVELDADVGFFRGLTLLPSLLKARRNPDGRTLQEMVPPEQYARWLPLKQRYIGRDRDVEEWRPIFAAFQLYEKAIEQQGMSQRGIVQDVVERAAKRAKVPVTQSIITLKIAEPKKAIREFSQTSLNDQECFRQTLDRIEGDLHNMRLRANAWAVGDVESLLGLSDYRSQFKACADALGSAEVARRAGFTNLQARLRDTWLAEAENMLSQHRVSFAVLPVAFLIGEEDALGRLAARGYMVESP